MSQSSVMAQLATHGPLAREPWCASRGEALAYCRNLAQSHYENFTVASWLLPRPLRPHFYAIYAYCRWADDLADEAPHERSLQLLDWWQTQLDRCFAGDADHPVFVSLTETIHEFSIPRQPFADLLVAFRQDQRTTRYETHADVLDYCRSSANPVGELILYLGRCHDPHRKALSDSICTGLQLANFCQDVARDYVRGRVYLPQATLAAAGYTDTMFARHECNTEFCGALAVEVDRAENYLVAGEPLVGLMPSELQLDTALFVAGGKSILQSISDAGFDVWTSRPTVTRLTKLRLLGRAWWQTRSPRRGRKPA